MLSAAFGMNGAERERRLRMNQITEADRVALRALKPVIERHMTTIVDAFYDHIGQFPDAMAIVTSAGSSLDRLKKTNPDYFAELFRGEFGDAYFESRFRIGKVHAVIGLEPQWFYAAMSTYYQVIYPILVDAYKFSPSRLKAAMVAFQKAFNLDQALVMEAYIEFGFVAELRSVVERSTEISEHLRESSAELRGAADESGRGVEELSHVSEQLAIAGTSQAEASQTAAYSMNKLSDASASMARAADTQKGAIDAAREAIESVQSSVREITEQAGMWEEIQGRMEGLEAVKQTVVDTSSRVAEMQQRAHEIGRIVNTIQDIAAQTNLLALNAAIEAARAGEMGRGFAVVADEVRKLAEHSSAATKEITTLIIAVQEGSAEASRSMDATMAGFQDASGITQSAALCLEGIARTAQQSNEENARLTQAMQRVDQVTRDNLDRLTGMTSEIDAVNASIENIAAISEENSASTEEMSASTQQLNAQVEQVVANITDLDQQVGELTDVIGAAQAVLAKSRRTPAGGASRRAA